MNEIRHPMMTDGMKIPTRSKNPYPSLSIPATQIRQFPSQTVFAFNCPMRASLSEFFKELLKKSAISLKIFSIFWNFVFRKHNSSRVITEHFKSQIASLFVRDDFDYERTEAYRNGGGGAGRRWVRPSMTKLLRRPEIAALSDQIINQANRNCYEWN